MGETSERGRGNSGRPAGSNNKAAGKINKARLSSGGEKKSRPFSISASGWEGRNEAAGESAGAAS